MSRSAWRVELAAGLGLLALAGACAGEDPRTQVMVSIELEGLAPGDLGPVSVAVRSGPGDAPSAWQVVHEATHPPSALPVLVALVPRDGDASRGYEVVASARSSALAERLAVRVQSGFVAERTLWLRVVLRARCLATALGDGCVDAVDPSTLPGWQEGATDADGGQRPPDAGRRDGGQVVEGDAAPPPECAAPGECPDDGEVCTRATCIDGRCGVESADGTCDDLDRCTSDDTCRNGVCRGTAIACTGGRVCDADMGECVCPSTALDCGGTCVEGARCCPGSAGGGCACGGTLRCNMAGTGFDCVFPSGLACTNPGGEHCSGTAPPCSCALSCQRRNCNDDCTIGGCFPSTC